MTLLDAGFFVVPVLAVLAPLATRGLGRWVRVPVVVFELLLGIIVGPSLLGWTQPTAFFEQLSAFGLAMLFFMAGCEIDFAAVAGRPLRRASLGWLLSLGAGIGLAWLVVPGEIAVFIGVALASTALGTLLPILRDAGELHSPWGRAVTAVGAVGEFGPLVAISLFLGSRDPGAATFVLGAFVLVAGLAIFAAVRFSSGHIHRIVNATLHTSGQMAIRIVFLMLGMLVALSIWLDLDMLLGAFAAGVVWKLIMRNAKEPVREAVESKLEAVAFGFLIPLFFIYTGVSFDLSALVADWQLALLVPLFLVALLVVRGIPSMLTAPPGSSRRDRVALLLLGGTGLPIIVAVTGIAVADGTMTSGVAAALIAAGMLSVLLFPFVGMALRGERSVVTSPPLDPVAIDAEPATFLKRFPDAEPDAEGARP